MNNTTSPTPTAVCPECKGRATQMGHQPNPVLYTKFGCWMCGHIFTIEKKPAQRANIFAYPPSLPP